MVIADHIIQTPVMSGLQAQHVAMIIWAYAKLGVVRDDLMRALTWLIVDYGLVMNFTALPM